jgi:hypothetical protein
VGGRRMRELPQAAASVFSATSTRAAESSTFFVAVFRLLAVSSNCLKDARSIRPDRFCRPRFASTLKATTAPVSTIARLIARSIISFKGNVFCFYAFQLAQEHCIREYRRAEQLGCHSFG